MRLSDPLVLASLVIGLAAAGCGSDAGSTQEPASSAALEAVLSLVDDADETPSAVSGGVLECVAPTPTAIPEEGAGPTPPGAVAGTISLDSPSPGDAELCRYEEMP